MLFGLSLLFTFLPVELGFPRFLGLSDLNMYQWLDLYRSRRGRAAG